MAKVHDILKETGRMIVGLKIDAGYKCGTWMDDVLSCLCFWELPGLWYATDMNSTCIFAGLNIPDCNYPVYACLDTCYSHFLTIIAGVDLHFRHESKLPVCRTRVAAVLGEAANHYTNDAWFQPYKLYAS